MDLVWKYIFEPFIHILQHFVLQLTIYPYFTTFRVTSQHGTQNVMTHNRATQKTKTMSNTDSTKKPGLNSGAREGQAVHASYKTPVVLLI
jgi:hypothetical protein